MARLRDIVSDVLEIDKDELSDTSLFKEDHGADSMGSIEILAELEKTYNVAIPETELIRMVNVEGVYAVLAEAAGWDAEV